MTPATWQVSGQPPPRSRAHDRARKRALAQLGSLASQQRRTVCLLMVTRRAADRQSLRRRCASNLLERRGATDDWSRLARRDGREIGPPSLVPVEPGFVRQVTRLPSFASLTEGPRGTIIHGCNSNLDFRFVSPMLERCRSRAWRRRQRWLSYPAVVKSAKGRRLAVAPRSPRAKGPWSRDQCRHPSMNDAWAAKGSTMGISS